MYYFHSCKMIRIAIFEVSFKKKKMILIKRLDLSSKNHKPWEQGQYCISYFNFKSWTIPDNLIKTVIKVQILEISAVYSVMNL